MRLESLHIRGLRCLSDVRLDLDPGINLFAGANGAGKTSVLEAAFLLSHARSFRSGTRDALLQRNASALSIFAELEQGNQRRVRLGLGRGIPARWEARVDGEDATIGRVVSECAVVCFEPGSHALIAGGAEERRRYLDWGVFHVEPDFLGAWRRYQRALKQRNHLLRNGVVQHELLEPWEVELAQTASQLDLQRDRYISLLRGHLARTLQTLLPELGAVELRYRRGWAEEGDLAELLQAHRGRDLARGHTTLGAHRADWSVSFEQAPMREHLSRGQEKLTALACLLAQASLYAELCGEWPIVCLDDLASELDQTHQAAVVQHLQGANAQVLVTGTDVPTPLQSTSHRLFHVEQGQLAVPAIITEL